MVRHNNEIPNRHFHKKYKRYIKTWFNQPMKKKRRALLRKRKAKSNLPKPAESLRPIVRCPTIRYNTKIRVGRGFSLEELRAAGLNKNYARSIGISVDARRRNVSVESQMLNVQRLKEYLNKLIVFPIQRKKRSSKIVLPSKVNRNINKIDVPKPKADARVPTSAEKAFGAYEQLRRSRFEKKLAKLKMKRESGMNENLDLMSTATRKV